MGKLKNILKVAFATVGSRVLGLVRDSFSMAYMGIGAVSSAYTFAFTLPNLFRRLLGEGALSGAIMPVFVHTSNQDGLEKAFSFLNKITTRALVWILFIVAVAAVVSLAAMCYFDESQTRYFLGAKYSLVLFPYLFFVCLAAVFSSVLNALGSFGVPSITPMFLNCCIIAALFCGVGIFGAADVENIALCMCFGWLAGGVVQLGLPAAFLMKKGWRFRFDMSYSPQVGELYALFLPALVGAAVVQLNIFVSKLLAFNIDDSATPALYVSSRILEFPLGVFTVAIATVYFPRLSKLAAQKLSADFKREYADGLVATMAIALPATFGIAALSKEILQMLFMWGLFDMKDIDICVPVLLVSVAGLPFFAWTSYATRGFHSNKDTKTPVRISYVSIAVNLVLSVALMFPFRAAGLAGANVAAAVFSSAALHFALKKKVGTERVSGDMAKIAAASVLMAAVCVALKELVVPQFGLDPKMGAFVSCVGIIPVAVAAYLVFLRLLNFERLSQLKRLIKK